MSFPGDPAVEEFLEKFVRDDFDIDYEDPKTKALMDALTKYQIGKSEARIAIAEAELSGAIKPKEGKRGESTEKNQDKPKIDPLEVVKHEFIKYIQEHPQPQSTTGKQTTPVSKSLTVVYDIAAAKQEVENAKNAPQEKKTAVNQFLDSLKENRAIIAPVMGPLLVEFVRHFLSSN